jgi:hypothetical protein
MDNSNPFALPSQPLQTYQQQPTSDESNPFHIDTASLNQQYQQSNGGASGNPFGQSGSGIIMGSSDTPSNWMSFSGDARNPFDEIDNEQRKQMRLNPYNGEQHGNKYLEHTKKVQGEFMKKIQKEQ